jgi:uncharacterized protein
MNFIIIIGLFLFVLMNTMAFFHAYHFTHFSKNQGQQVSQVPAWWGKLKLMFLGVSNPKPMAQALPSKPYQDLLIDGEWPVHAWFFEQNQAKGTVILAHGYASQKSNMLDRSEAFLAMGYSTLLIDFMGCGQSETYQTTMGFYEAQQIIDSFAHLQAQGHKNIILYGKSMGAVAIAKAMQHGALPAKALILESAFGSMYRTVCARFTGMGLPSFPMAALLSFWGSVQNDFWAFGHNPIAYAQNINCPSLVMVGEADDKVSMKDSQAIYQNIAHSHKKMVSFPMAGHQNLLQHSPDIWQAAVADFLEHLPSAKH